MLQNLAYIVVCAILLTTYLLAVLMAALWRSVQARRKTPVLEADERPKLLAALVERICTQSARHPQALSAFLDAYLGDATVAKQQAWDAARVDPDSVREMCRDYFQKKSDQQLLEAFVEGSPVAPRLAVGFDARERLDRVREARRLFDSTQIKVVLGGAAMLLLMLVAPPWIRQRDDVTWMLLSVQSREILAEEFMGYHPVFSSKLPPDEIERIHTGDLGKTRQKRNRTRIAARLLVPQILLLTAIVAALTYSSRQTRFEQGRASDPPDGPRDEDG